MLKRRVPARRKFSAGLLDSHQGLLYLHFSPTPSKFRHHLLQEGLYGWLRQHAHAGLRDQH